MSIRCEKERYIKHRHSNDVILKCNHCFHRHCIKKWFITSVQEHGNGTCPCCRSELKFKEGGYFNQLIKSYALWSYSDESDDDNDLDNDIDDEFFGYASIRYIYHDNAGCLLFINDILIYLLHYCNMYMWIKYKSNKKN
jgi:hypothetical protein